MTETARFYQIEITSLMETLTWMNGGIYQEFDGILYTLHSNFERTKWFEQLVKWFSKAIKRK